MSDIIKGYKLFRLRADGTLGPLFINARLRVEDGRWYKAEAHRTTGFAFRPGWHACRHPHAPHLGTAGRIWCEVELRGVTLEERPESQGGAWYLAQELRVTGRRPDLMPGHPNFPAVQVDNVEDVINGLKHMADDHPCCKQSVQKAIETLEAVMGGVERGPGPKPLYEAPSRGLVNARATTETQNEMIDGARRAASRLMCEITTLRGAIDQIRLAEPHGHTRTAYEEAFIRARAIAQEAHQRSGGTPK
jgi:hypothetical protein